MLLLNFYADIDSQDNDGYTALHNASERNDLKMIQMVQMN